MDKRNNDYELLARLEERVARNSQLLNEMREDIKDIKEDIQSRYVTKAEHAPVQRAVYSAIGLILAAFVSALVFIVFGVHIK